MSRRFRRLSHWLAERHGQRVFKVSLRGGFSCPNRDGTVATGGCTFCAGDALEPNIYQPEQTVEQQLQAGMDYIRERHGAERFIAYFQDYSATYAPTPRLRELYLSVLRPPQVVGLAVGTRPDCLPPPTLELLAELRQAKAGGKGPTGFAGRAARSDRKAGLAEIWVELGLQIASDRLLGELNRGHTVEDFRRAVRACHDRNLPVCAHVIVGLPGASAQLELQTIRLLAELDVWGIKLHAFHVLSNASIAERYKRGELAALLDRDSYVGRVVDLLEQIPDGVVIHRVTAEAPRRLTLAPQWTVNKMAVFDAVIDELRRRDSWQGCRIGCRRPASD